MIDEYLHLTFPDIIPKAWYGLYHTFVRSMRRKGDLLIKELKWQPGDLNYNKVRSNF